MNRYVQGDDDDLSTLGSEAGDDASPQMYSPRRKRRERVRVHSMHAPWRWTTSRAAIRRMMTRRESESLMARAGATGCEARWRRRQGRREGCGLRASDEGEGGGGRRGGRRARPEGETGATDAQARVAGHFMCEGLETGLPEG